MRKMVLGISAAILCLGVTLSGRWARAGSDAAAASGRVQIDVPADVPLRIVNFGFDASPAGMTAFHYDVKNVSGQGLVAVEVRWRSGGASFSNRDDRWLTGQLAAGESEHFQVSNVPGASSPNREPNPTSQSSSRLTMKITYAELEDGARVGTDAAQVGKEIDAARRAELASYAKLLETFNAGGSEALVHALKPAIATPTATAATALEPGVQAAAARLAGILNDQGVDAVVLELQRVSALSLPESRP
ncbi:MAG TPA: hypothetical protein VI455_11990 [Terriglobia bacterium]